MRERPILFSGPMVRAILAGQKTQTRRVVKGSESIRYFGRCEDDRGYAHPDRVCDPRDGFHYHDANGFHHGELTCPYGQPGDRLWAKETHRVKAWNEVARARVEYRADGAEFCLDVLTDDYDAWILRRTAIWERAGARVRADGLLPEPPGGVPWTPSIHLPRWASRITLEVTSVRVERLHTITEDDARAEGCEATVCDAPDDSRTLFRDLWESINGEASWEANPWVWVVSFKRIEVRHG